MDDLVIITGPELVSYPGAGSPTLTDAHTYANLVNGLIAEAWREPVTPVPMWVKAIALEVGARAARNPKGLQSWTRSVDDASRTERYADSSKAGVYLTDDERTRLGGRSRRRQRYGTIRLGLGY